MASSLCERNSSFTVCPACEKEERDVVLGIENNSTPGLHLVLSLADAPRGGGADAELTCCGELAAALAVSRSFPLKVVVVVGGVGEGVEPVDRRLERDSMDKEEGRVAVIVVGSTGRARVGG